MEKVKRDRNGVIVYLEDSITRWKTTKGTCLTTSPLVCPVSGEILAMGNEAMTREQYNRCIELDPIAFDGTPWRQSVISGVFVSCDIVPGA